MSSDASPVVLAARDVSKAYHLYRRPHDRLLQFLARGQKQFYEEFWALRNVSFELRRGSSIGVLGRNGAGKSTLLQLVCQTLAPTVGTIETNGRIAALLELGAGFDPELSGRENVHLYASVLGLSPQEIRDKYDDIVAFSEIEPFIDRPVKTYSSGMFVRLAFSVAIHVDPEILIIDEALAVGDGRFAQRCTARIRKLRERGVSLLFVSHDIEAVRRLCDHAIVLDQGRVVQQGDAAHVANWYLAFMTADFDLGRLDEIERRAAQADAAGSAPVTSQTIAEDSGTDEPDPVPLRETKAERPASLREAPRANSAVEPSPPPAVPVAGESTPPEEGERPPEFRKYRYGDGAARIVDVYLVDDDGHRTDTVMLGSGITLCLDCRFEQDTPEHLVGFYVRDRLGADVIGINTFQEGVAPPAVAAGGRVRHRIRFSVDVKPGEYGVCPSIAYNQFDGRWMDYIENALVFRVSDPVAKRTVFGVTLPRQRSVAIDVLEPGSATAAAPAQAARPAQAHPGPQTPAQSDA